VLIFVPEVAQVLAQIYRVLRPAGCLVTSETDQETFLVDSPFPETSRKLFDALAQSMPHRHLGRELPRLLAAARFHNVRLFPRVVYPPFNMFEQIFSAVLRESIEKGVVSHQEASEWFEAMREADRVGTYVFCITVFTALGQK